MTAASRWSMSNPWTAMPGWLPVVALMVVTGVVGPYLGSMARPLFLLGALVVGWQAWQRSPGLHFQVLIALFCFAPLLRRLVDLNTGFDQSGLMVAAPLLAMVAPVAELKALVRPGRTPDRELRPFFLFAACVAYAASLTLLQGQFSQVATGFLKWGAPAVYGFALYLRRPDPEEMLQRAADAFLIILPITGFYGIYQYVNPPDWDRYWLSLASILSAGLPEPYMVRVFSTMHAPAAFATFTATGLLIVYFLRTNLLARLALMPAALALLLSLYRTAWLGLGVGLIFCLLLPATRGRVSSAVFAGMVGAALIPLTPFATVITDRVSTFGSASSDASGLERLGQFVNLYNRGERGLIGDGFVTVDVGVAGSVAVDGLFSASWVTMGLIVGLLCVTAVTVVLVRAILNCWRVGTVPSGVYGALLVGTLVELPLAGIVVGELGFLMWAFASLALLLRHPSQIQPPAATPCH